MDYRAEYGVIGSVLLSPGCLDGVREIVSARDFQTEYGRKVFEAFCRLSDGGRGIDPITVTAEAPDVPEQWLAEVLDVTPTAAHVLEYARQLRKERQLTAIRASLGDLTAKAADADAEPAELIVAMQEAAAQAGEGFAASVIPPDEGLIGFSKHVEDVRKGKKITVPTGFPSIDNILGGGMLRTGLYIIAARPGVGKTSLGLIIADLAARSRRVLFVSLEMSETEILARRCANVSGIRIGRLLHTPLTDEEAEKFSNHMTELGNREFYMNRSNTATVAEIGVMARSCRAELVVIDYLGLIRSEERGLSSYERITGISGDLKRLARSLGCPVLCLAQLNRQSEARSDKRPQMSDLRDSGAIEQDADGILLIHRPMLYAKEPLAEYDGQPFEVEVAKNRHGPTGRATLQWWAADGRFQDSGTNSWQ